MVEGLGSNVGLWPTFKEYKTQTNSLLAFQMHFQALASLI
jgi:hypothetical protein